MRTSYTNIVKSWQYLILALTKPMKGTHDENWNGIQAEAKDFFYHMGLDVVCSFDDMLGFEFGGKAHSLIMPLSKTQICVNGKLYDVSVVFKMTRDMIHTAREHEDWAFELYSPFTYWTVVSEVEGECNEVLDLEFSRYEDAIDYRYLSQLIELQENSSERV